MDFKGVIFDFDGTIFDSMKDWETIGYDFLANHEVTPPDDLKEALRPLGFMQTVEYLVKQFELQCSIQEAWEEIVQMVREIYADKAALKPYAIELLTLLKSKGTKMCIATATDGALAVMAMKRLGIEEYFEFLINCDEVGAGKDVPDIYNTALERLGFDKSEVAVLEDSYICAKTAKDAGYYTIGVYEPLYAPFREQMQAMCDRYVISLNELL